MPSPTPTSFTGRPSSCAIVRATPPFAEPSSFVSATPPAVQRYEAWCRQHGKTPEKDKDIEIEFRVQLGNSLSEYIAILHIDD